MWTIPVRFPMVGQVIPWKSSYVIDLEPAEALWLMAERQADAHPEMTFRTFVRLCRAAFRGEAPSRVDL